MSITNYFNAWLIISKTHEMTNSRVHGIELSAARRAFGVLGSLPPKKILQMVSKLKHMTSIDIRKAE